MGLSYIDVSGLDEFAARLELTRAKVDNIAQGTVNRAASMGRTMVARAVRKEVRISYGSALKQVRISKALLSAGISTATITASKKGLLLSEYKFRSAGRAGVDVQVGQESGFKRVPYAFVMRAKNGKDIIGYRKPGQKKYNTLYGPSASQVFDTLRPVIAADLEDWIAKEMNRRMQVEVVGQGRYNLPPIQDALNG